MSQPTAWDGQEATAATALRQAVKPDHQARFSAIVGCIVAVCAKYLAPLGDEYAALGQLLAALCCQEGSPVVEGRAKPESWAAGILWTIGSVNFLSDRSFQPTMTGKELAAACGVSEATMQARCRDIRDGLDIQQLDPRWTLPSRIGDNPMTWMFETNGIILDFRDAPRDVQADGVFVGRRDQPKSAGSSREEFLANLPTILAEMQQGLFDRAAEFREKNTVRLDTLDEFKQYFAEDAPGGFAWCHWSESPEMEQQLKQLKVTARNIPIGQEPEDGKCIFTGQPSSTRAVFARAY